MVVRIKTIINVTTKAYPMHIMQHTDFTLTDNQVMCENKQCPKLYTLFSVCFLFNWLALTKCIGLTFIFVLCFQLKVYSRALTAIDVAGL